MIRRADTTVSDSLGTPEPGVYITVKRDTGALATIYADNGGLMANPFQSGAGGAFAYNISDTDAGTYTEEYRLSLSSIPRRVQTITLGASSVNVVLSRTAMAARATPAVNDQVYLSEAGREGSFVVDLASNWTAQIAADTAQGLFVASTADATKVYRRVVGDHHNIKWFGAKCDTSKFGVGGTDDTAAVQAAIDYVNSLGGGKIYVPGHTKCAGSLNLSGKSNIEFVGPSGIMGYNAPPAGQLIFTGTGSSPFIDASHSNAVAFNSVGVRYTSGSFTGDLIAYTNLTAGADAAYGRVEGCLVSGMYNGGVYVASARSLISLEGAILCQVVGNHLAFAAAGIRGAKEISVGNVLYSNAHVISRNTFDNVTNAIMNAAQSWTVSGNWFEGTNGGMGGMQHAYYSDISAASAAGSTSLVWSDNWHGDKVAGGAWFDNNFMGIRGLKMSGNYFDTGGPVDCVKLASTVQGGDISGNAFSSGIDFASVGHYGLRVDGNFWSVEPKNLAASAEDIQIVSNKLNSANAAITIRMFKVAEHRIGYPGAVGATGTFAYYAGGAVDAELFVSGDTNRQKAFSLKRGNEKRWSLVSTSETESGSNAGSNYQLIRYDDAGTFLGAALTVNRATADADLAGNLNVASGKVYKLNGTQVVGARGAAVADAVNAAAAPTQAEFNALVTQFNLLLARLRASTGHGLIA